MRKLATVIGTAALLTLGCNATWAKNGITSGTFGGLGFRAPINHSKDEAVVLFFSTRRAENRIPRLENSPVELMFSSADGAVLKSVTMQVPPAGYRRVVVSVQQVNSTEAELYVDVPGGMELVGLVPLDNYGRVDYELKVDHPEGSHDTLPAVIQIGGALVSGSTGATKAIWIPSKLFPPTP